mgnify:CR=1 FL=1
MTLWQDEQEALAAALEMSRAAIAWPKDVKGQVTA